MKKQNIEVEGGEILLMSKEGHYAVIPAKHRQEVMDMIKDGCDDCINNYIQTLPKDSDYAQDGSLLPDWDKKNNFKYKRPTTVQDNAYIAPRRFIPVDLEQMKREQLEQMKREQPVFKADTRTDQERKRAQEYTESVLNPSISTQIDEALQKPLRWIADPVKVVGDLVSSVAPNSPLAKDLPNTNEETFEYRKKQLNPYISNKEKRNNTFNEAISLTNWALLNTLPVEAAASYMIKSGRNLIKPISKVVGKTDDATKVGSKVLSKTDDVVKPVSKIVDKVDDITENLKHLEYAKNYYSKYGYNIPENLAEIAKDSKLTDEIIQGLVNQHNTFVRGVSTNWDELAKKNPEILRHLEEKGIDYINNPQAAAEYMSTHVPIQTGYGRAGLNENIFREGKDAIYTSNSIPTAEGYTYGDGYIVKVKRPTDFSSKNRIDWIQNNKLDYFEDNLKDAPKEIKDKFVKLTEERYIKEIEPKYFDKNGNWKNGKVLQKDLAYDVWKMEQEVRQQLGLPVEKSHNLLKTEHSNKSYLEQINNDMLTCEQFLDRIGVQESTKKMTEIAKEVSKKYNPKLIKLEKEIFDIRRKYPKDNVTKKRFGLNDYKIEDKYNDLLRELESTREKLTLEVKQQQLKYLKDNYGDKLNEVDRYAHYLHIGTPGQKLLEPIEAIRITPDIWKNKSRAHTNAFSKGLSAGSLIPFYLYLQSQQQNKSEQ